MAMPRQTTMDRRKKWEEQQRRKRERLKELKADIKRDAQKITRLQEKEEKLKREIIGKFVLEKIAQDNSFKVWFDGEIHSYLKTEREKALFGLPQNNQRT